MSPVNVLPVALGHLINTLLEAIAATAHDTISLRVVALFQERLFNLECSQAISSLKRVYPALIRCGV